MGLTRTTQIYDSVYGSTIDNEIGQQQQQRLKETFNHGQMLKVTRKISNKLFVQTNIKSKFIIVSCVCDHRPFQMLNF